MTKNWNTSKLAMTVILLAGVASSAARAEMTIQRDCKDNHHPVALAGPEPRWSSTELI